MIAKKKEHISGHVSEGVRYEQWVPYTNDIRSAG